VRDGLAAQEDEAQLGVELQAERDVLFRVLRRDAAAPNVQTVAGVGQFDRSARKARAQLLREGRPGVVGLQAVVDVDAKDRIGGRDDEPDAEIGGQELESVVGRGGVKPICRVARIARVQLRTERNFVGLPWLAWLRGRVDATEDELLER
jgi:hypothetical protein